MAIGFIQDELDLKMLVLYIMSRVAAPISFQQLLELALCDAGVDYFSLTQAAGDLVEKQLLRREGELYHITQAGRRNSAICESSLPYSVRRRCDESLIPVNAALRRKEQVQSGVAPLPGGDCTVRLTLSDGRGDLLNLRAYLPSVQAGEELSARFQRAPEKVYHAVMAALLSETDTPQPEQPATKK